jgi:hypothetical protein
MAKAPRRRLWRRERDGILPETGFMGGMGVIGRMMVAKTQLVFRQIDDSGD